jgi:hypothetical protein
MQGEKEATVHCPSIHKGSTQLQHQYIPNQCILIIDTHSILFCVKENIQTIGARRAIRVFQQIAVSLRQTHHILTAFVT